MERFSKKKYDRWVRRVESCRSRRAADGRGYTLPEFSPERLVAARHRMNLSQADFARMLHVSVGTLQNWEQGRRAPSGPAEALIYMVQREPMAALRALRVTLNRMLAEPPVASAARHCRRRIPR